MLPLKPNDYFYTTIGGRRFTLEDDATIGGVPIVGFPGLSAIFPFLLFVDVLRLRDSL